MRNFINKFQKSETGENPVKVENSESGENSVKVEKPKKEKKVKEPIKPKEPKEKKEKKPKKEKIVKPKEPLRPKKEEKPKDVEQPAKLKKFNMHPKILNVKEFVRKDKEEFHVNVMIMRKEKRVRISNFRKAFMVLTEMFYEYVDITKVNGMFYLRRFVSQGFQR